MPNPATIETPDSPALDELCQLLRDRADALDASQSWPREQLTACGEYGVFKWFVPEQLGGLGWSDADVVRGYLRLSAACLTTTFVITQRTGACRRLVASPNEDLRDRLLPPLVTGETFATVGISHLTTSRRHLKKPVLLATETPDGVVLDGFSPWVTGGKHAQHVVMGATCEDGRQVLVALPMELDGVRAADPVNLMGLTASHTGAVHCNKVKVLSEWILDGPVENVMSRGTGAGTGGLQTSTLAIGLSTAAIEFLEKEAEARPDLAGPADQMRAQRDELTAQLLEMAVGNNVCTHEDLRGRANSLALRTSQAALAAAKGTGYVTGHPAGRWCREALFFLVWSCPQPVAQAYLCELAGLQSS